METPITSENLKAKVRKYLEQNNYRVINETEQSIIFVDDEFSNRNTSKSDYYRRIDDGKLDIKKTDSGTEIELICLVSMTYELIVTVGLAAASIFIEPIFFVLSVIITLHFALKIYLLKSNIVRDIMETQPQ
jgi:hypothetical protein